jgi:hypothetical protein
MVCNATLGFRDLLQQPKNSTKENEMKHTKMTKEQRVAFEAKARQAGYTNFTMRSADFYADAHLNALAEGFLLAHTL